MPKVFEALILELVRLIYSREGSKHQARDCLERIFYERKQIETVIEEELKQSVLNVCVLKLV